MSTDNWRAWGREYVLPAMLVISTGVLWIVIWGDLNILAFGVAYAIAFVTGLLLHPSRTWVMPAAVVFLFALVVYALEIIGWSEPETNIGLIPGLALIVGLPLTLLNWLGRECGGTPRATEDARPSRGLLQRKRRHAEQTTGSR